MEMYVSIKIDYRLVDIGERFEMDQPGYNNELETVLMSVKSCLKLQSLYIRLSFTAGRQ